MKFIQIISNSNVRQVEILLKCALDRYPIIVEGENEEIIEEFINGISKLISFRNHSIFYNDFISSDDYEIILSNEESDYWIQRNLFICYPFSMTKMVEEITEFQSWIIGYNKNDEIQSTALETLKNVLNRNDTDHLYVIVKDKGIITKLTESNPSSFNLDFEKMIYQNAISRTEKTIEKMKRIISKGLKNPDINENEVDDLMDFSLEGEELKENLIKKEIMNFFEACKRAFNILNRIQILESLEINISLSKRTLNSIVAYKFAPISRILDFIKAEWNLDFETIFDTKKLSNFTDTFESMWG